MAYCRWSSLGGYSDVYVYEDVNGGWTTHIAERRHKPGHPYHELDLMLAGVEGRRLYNEISEIIKNGQYEWEPIDHPMAGQSFNHGTPGACADFLEKCASSGLVVPYDAIAALRNEAEEDANRAS